ncbi:MAG: hypothetical protein QXR60_02810 [Candidatus Nanoarchaeia archaeon]
MRRSLIFGLCIVLLTVMFSLIAGSFNLINAWVCKEISASGALDFDNPAFIQQVIINCDVETDKFTTEDEYVFFVANFDMNDTDKFGLEITGPNNFKETESDVSEVNVTNIYGFHAMPIAGKAVGTYTAKLFANGETVYTKQFTISQPDYTCEHNNYVCCPSGKICLKRADSKYICTSGTCCDPLMCLQPVSGELTLTLVPDCTAEGLDDCHMVIGNVYNYNIHGPLETPATIELFFRDVDVDCFNKKNVAIGVYDELNISNGTSAWITYDSTVTKLTGNYYSITAKIDYVGYIAVVKSPKCVPLDCFIPGFSTQPFNGNVQVGNPIRLGVCQITKFCEAIADGLCDKRCTQGLDPDCGELECTSNINDCCNPERDKKCDLDCAIWMDPDCADEEYLGGLCYPSAPELRGFTSCDIHCTGADPMCGEPGCHPGADGECDPNCPMLSNRKGYLDVDCCAVHGVSVTNNGGDCCNRESDDVCDPDCLPGLDHDCNKKITCNPNGVKESFELCDGNDLGGQTCASYLGTCYLGNLTCTSNCKFDTSACVYDSACYGGW